MVVGPLAVACFGDHLRARQSPATKFTMLRKQAGYTGLQVKLFIETFTEQFSTFALLRASSKAQLKEREEKFVAGLKVRPSLPVGAEARLCVRSILSLGARFISNHADRLATCLPYTY